MRSRMSRGVLEWSRGKDLYMGSPVSVTGIVSGVINIVPGPPKGVRGSTGWGHLPRGTKWAESGWEPAPSGLVHPPPKGPRRLGFGNHRGGGRLHLAWGASLPPGCRPPSRWDLEGGGGQGGGGLPPKQGGAPFRVPPTLGAWAQGGLAPNPLRGWFPSTYSP